jgi:hypothetical protein
VNGEDQTYPDKVARITASMTIGMVTEVLSTGNKTVTGSLPFRAVIAKSENDLHLPLDP